MNDLTKCSKCPFAKTLSKIDSDQWEGAHSLCTLSGLVMETEDICNTMITCPQSELDRLRIDSAFREETRRRFA